MSLTLGTYELPQAKLVNNQPVYKTASHQYDWSDENYISDMGMGIRGLRVAGLVTGLSARDALEQALETARGTATNLYFPSIIGADGDRYYIVQTLGYSMTPAGGSATSYTYEVAFGCADPYQYETATSTRVWG